MIRFGTGGWRAVIADGFTRENIRLLTAGLCRHILKIPGCINQCFQQLMNRRINGHLPVMLQYG